jgi:protein-S-isoprenylcysteine O-methyltransferase Ste14
MKRRLKINGVIVFIVLLLIAIFPSVFFRHNLLGSFDEVAEILGVAFILLGQIFRASARGYKSEHSQQGLTLIKTGPYAFVRNPMYLGILLIGLGIVLMLFRWWVAFIFMSVFIIRYILLIFKEEKKLLTLFPQEYKDYQERVPSIVPSLATLLEKDISEYAPLKPSWLKKEMGTILAVLFITIFIESWRDIYQDGVVAYLEEAIAVTIITVFFIGLIIYLIRKTDNPSKDVSNKGEINL